MTYMKGKMDIVEFEAQIDKILQKRSEDYPYASFYMRIMCCQLASSALANCLHNLQGQIDRDEEYWKNLESVISDILHVKQIAPEKLFGIEIPQLPKDTNDFQTIKEKLYETEFYPISEHLHYIDFEAALDRKRFILKHLSRMDKETVEFCDLGFGPGVLLCLILSQRSSWIGYGVDVSYQCIRYAQRMLEIKGLSDRAKLSIADIRELPYLNEQFDLVVGMEVFEHIPDPKEGLTEAVRVLKTGGYAITAIPVQLPLTMHLYVFNDTQEIFELYKNVGLKVLDFEAKEYQRVQGSFIDTFTLSVKETQ